MQDYDEDSTKNNPQGLKDFLVGYWWVLILLLAWVLGRRYMGSDYTPRADLIFLFAGLMVAVGKLTFLELKQRTPKICADGVFSTTQGTYSLAGNYAIFRLNEIDCGIKYPPDWAGGKGAIICPLDAINKRGRSVALQVQAIQTKTNELPIEVQENLLERKIKPPYYMGYCDIEQLKQEIDLEKLKGSDLIEIYGVKKTDVMNLIHIIRDQNRFISQQKQLLLHDRSSLETEMKYLNRMDIHKTSSSNIFKRMFGKNED